MAHLSPDQFIDFAEGTPVPAAAAAHLDACARCREQLAQIQAATLMVAEGREAVPEPSPLFWEHFSDRVRNAVAAEPEPAVAWWRGALRWPAAVTAAVAVLAVAVLTRLPAPVPPAPAASVEQAADVNVPAPAEDPSLNLLVDLAASMDWDTADVDFGAGVSATEQTLFELDPAERSELHRLLSEALDSGPGV